MKLDQLPINWFDLAVAGILIFGLTRGRKHGMSVEMMFMLQWLAMIFGAAYAWKPVGDFLASESPMSHLTCYITAYVATAVGIKMFWSLIRRAVGGKLLGSNIFGAGEYYLGMVGGIVRFACVIIFFLSLLNARRVTTAEVTAHAAYNRKYYGGQMNNGDFFPSIHDVQMSVFANSFTGRNVHDRLAFLFITPTELEPVQLKRAIEFELK